MRAVRPGRGGFLMPKKNVHKEGFDAKLMHELNANLARLGKTLRALNSRGIDTEAVGGFKGFWNNLMAGLARGLGMVFGMSFMTFIGLGIIAAALYWLLDYLHMVPFLSGLADKLSDILHKFIENNRGQE